MKRTTIHISAAIALLLGFAACTQDEAGFLPEGAEGTPIVFTATGLNPVATATVGTRAPADGNWEGVQSVAVLMDGTVKTYNVTPSTADNTSATLTSTDPYYWTNHNDITVTAWWPYTAGETTPPAVKVKANQSAQKDFEGSDLIVADGQTVTYGSPTLRFTHRTARVTIVLTDYTEGLASVQLTGLSTEGDNPDIIVPYDKGSNTYTAIVAPQSVAAGTTFITCTFTNGKTFVYKMKNATDWQAGGEYTYTVSLAAAKDLGYTIESNGSYTVTSADGLMNIAKLVNGGKTDINITLTADIDLTGKNWTPIGTSFSNKYTGTFDGGGHTINPIPCDEVDSVFALNSSQHSAVEIRQHLVAVLQTVGFQKGRHLHLPHIFRCVSDDLIHHVLGSDPFWLVNILIAVGNTTALSYFTKRRTVKQDTQPVSVNFVQLETLLGKDDCCFSEVTDLFFCADAHIAPPMHKK